MKGLLLTALLLAQARGPQIETGAIAGRLLSTNGSPAAGVRVAATPVPEKADNLEAPVLIGLSQTDASGRFRLEGIPPGRYYVLAGLIDYPNYYPGTTAVASATAVDVDSGGTVADLDFTLARPVATRVAGRVVVSPTLSRALITLLLTPRTLARGGTVVMQATTDNNGSFVFPQVAPGDYRLSSVMRGSSPLDVSVVDRDIEDLVVTFVDCNSGAQIRGKLTGMPTSPVRTIALNGSAVGCNPVAAVENDGSFEFRGVPEGTYSIRLNPTPAGFNGANVVVGTSDIAALDVALPRSVEVKGRLTVEDGSDPPRLARSAPIPIQAMSQSTNPGSAGLSATQNIANDGSFELHLISGSYRITASALPRGYFVKSITYGSIDLTLGNLDVVESSSNTIDIVLGFSGSSRPGVRVSGRVIPPAGGALAKTESVILAPSSGGRYAPVVETAVAADGSFEFRGITPGSYDLQTVPDSPASVRNIAVNRTDITGIEFTLPVLYKVNGVIEWAGGGGGSASSSSDAVSVQFLKQNLTDDPEPKETRVWSALGQAGMFQAYLPEGDYRFSVTGIPPAFGLGAAMFGSVNLLTSDLPVRSASNPLEIRVLLRGKN